MSNLPSSPGYSGASGTPDAPGASSAAIHTGVASTNGKSGTVSAFMSPSTLGTPSAPSTPSTCAITPGTLPPASNVVWPMSARIFLVLGALSAGASVVFSAAFAHLPVFASGVPTAVQTALGQQQYHALGLLFLGLAIRMGGASRWWLVAGVLMVLGTVLFSFNLYARYVWGWDALRAQVPWGGMAWILAWLSLAMGGWHTGLWPQRQP